LYSSTNIIRQIKSRRMRWGDMWHAWERRVKYTDFRWESRRKETTRKTEAWMDGIRMDLRETGWGC
jgi:hypothetical protein